MQIQSNYNNPAFGTHVMLSDTAIAAMRNFESQNHGLKINSLKKQISRLSENGKEHELLLVYGNSNATSLTVILMNDIHKKYSNATYKLNNLPENTKLTLYKIYKSLDIKLKMIISGNA